MPRAPDLSALPELVLDAVYEACDPEDQAALRCTCTRLRQTGYAATTKFLVKIWHFRDFCDAHSLDKFPGVHTVVLTGFPGIDEEQNIGAYFAHLEQSAPRVHTVSIPGQIMNVKHMAATKRLKFDVAVDAQSPERHPALVALATAGRVGAIHQLTVSSRSDMEVVMAMAPYLTEVTLQLDENAGPLLSAMPPLPNLHTLTLYGERGYRRVNHTVDTAGEEHLLRIMPSRHLKNLFFDGCFFEDVFGLSGLLRAVRVTTLHYRASEIFMDELSVVTSAASSRRAGRRPKDVVINDVSGAVMENYGATFYYKAVSAGFYLAVTASNVFSVLSNLGRYYTRCPEPVSLKLCCYDDSDYLMIDAAIRAAVVGWSGKYRPRIYKVSIMVGDDSDDWLKETRAACCDAGIQFERVTYEDTLWGFLN